jgi:hypothetical protein
MVRYKAKFMAVDILRCVISATNGKRKLHVLDIEKTSIKRLSQCAFRGITRNSKILEKIAHEQFSLKMYSIHDLKSLFTEIQTLFNMHFSYISC